MRASIFFSNFFPIRTKVKVEAGFQPKLIFDPLLFVESV